MNNRKNAASPDKAVTRRQAIAGIAIALGGLAAGSRAVGQDQQPAAKEAPGTAPKKTRTSLHYEVDYKAVPQRIYELLLDPKQFAAMTGRAADLDPREGGAFSLFGGLIVGRNVELVPNERIVQAWRPTHWDPGVYSVVRFELRGLGTQTTLVLDHTGYPEAESEALDSGWKGHYLVPIAKFLG
jgi:activator of HSP90 ATPase